MSELRRDGLVGEGGIILGKLRGQFVSLPHSLNALNFGRQGTGETSALMAPNLLMHPDWTVIVVDPKGSELYNLTRRFRRQAGDTVRRLNPWERETSIQCNPLQVLQFCNQYTPPGTLRTLAKQIIPETSTRDSHFDLLAQMIWAGVARHLWETERARCTLPEIANEICGQGPAHLLRFINDIQRDGGPQARIAVNAFETAGDKERGSFFTSLAKRLDIWSDEGVAALSDADGLNWHDVLLGAQPSTVYLNMPSGQSEYYGSWARVLLSSFLLEATRIYDERGTAFERPVLLLIDEADSLGSSEQIESTITKLRAMGVSIVMRMQSLEQLKANDPKAGAIRDACEAWMISGGEKTLGLAREISELGGDDTIETASRSESEHGRSEGSGQAPRRLIKPDEIRSLPKDAQILEIGRHFVKCRKAYWFEDERMRGRLSG